MSLAVTMPSSTRLFQLKKVPCPQNPVSSTQAAAITSNTLTQHKGRCPKDDQKLGSRDVKHASGGCCRWRYLDSTMHATCVYVKTLSHHDATASLGPAPQSATFPCTVLM